MKKLLRIKGSTAFMEFSFIPPIIFHRKLEFFLPHLNN